MVRLLFEDSPGGPYRALGLMTTAAQNPLKDAQTHGLDVHYLAADGSLKWDLQTYMSEIDGERNGLGGFIDFEYTFRQGLVQRLGIEYNDPHVDLDDLGFLWRNDNFRLRSAHTRTSANLRRARDNQFDARGFVQISKGDALRSSAGELLQSAKPDLFTGGGIFLANRTVFNGLSSLTLRGHIYPESYDDINSFGNGAFRTENRTDFIMNWDSDGSKRVAYGFGFALPDEVLGGAAWNAELRANWRPSDRFSLIFRARYSDRKGWLVHSKNEGDRTMTGYNAKQWVPHLSANYFINARQQFRISLQWVGIRAKDQQRYLIPDEPGDLIPVSPDYGGGRPVRDFSLSQLSLQLRYRWEIAPLSDVFLVYTRLADETTALKSFGNTFQDSYHNPLVSRLILKLRYRFGP